MAGMVTELDNPEADIADKSTKKRGIHIVDGDEGSPVPKSKVSLEHICIVRKGTHVHNY